MSPRCLILSTKVESVFDNDLVVFNTGQRHDCLRKLLCKQLVLGSTLRIVYLASVYSYSFGSAKILERNAIDETLWGAFSRVHSIKGIWVITTSHFSISFGRPAK